MASLGISTKVANARIEVAVVGIDRTSDEPDANPNLHYRVDANEDQAQQLRGLTNAVRPLLTDGVDVVVVGTFDYGHQQRIADWVKLRLRAEGALAAMAREYSPDVRVLTGRDMANVLGCTKDELKLKASETLPEGETGAVMAALAAEALLL